MALTNYLLLFVSILGLAAGRQALLGAQKCTFGPSYWCSSLGNAKECTAVDHCIDSVWHNLQLPADNDGICDLCKGMVQEAQQYITSNDTEAEIEGLFDQTCQLIPLAEVRKTCEDIGAQYIPEVLQLLSSDLNPQEVCAAAQLCNSVAIDVQLQQHGLQDWRQSQGIVARYGEPDPGDCDDCHAYLDDMIHLTRKYGKAELMSRLLSICSQLGSLSDGCAALVEVNIDVIFQFITKDLDVDQACMLFGMCEGSRAQVLKANSGSQGCDICVSTADYIKQQLVTNNTMDAYKAMLESLCTQTGSFGAECKALVDSFYQASYQWLVKDFDAVQVCTDAGICGPSRQDKALWTTLDTTRGQKPIELHWAGGDENVPVTAEVMGVKVTVLGQSGVKSDDTCVLCQFTLHFIQQQLNDPKNVKSLEEVVKGVCPYLPKSLAEQCQDYIDAYGDQVIALIQQELDPSVICPELGLCPGEGLMEVPPQQHLRDVPCVMCEYVMVQIKEMLGDRTNQEAVKHALDSVCSLMPHSLEKECVVFMDENSVEIMQLISMGIEPEQVCKELGLCYDKVAPIDELPALTAADQLPLARMVVPAQEQLPELAAQQQLPLSRLFSPRQMQYGLENTGQSKCCITCEFVLNVLEHMVLDNNTHIEEDIKVGLERVCVLFPMTVADECLTFVEQYTVPVVEMIVHGIRPSSVCEALTLCRPAALPVAHLVSVPERVRRSAAPHPETCTVCRALAANPEDPMGVCQAAVRDLQDFETSHCDWIVDQLSTSGECGQVHSDCAPQRGMLGRSRCTWGPSYWCDKHINALSCGSVAWCEEKNMGFAASRK